MKRIITMAMAFAATAALSAQNYKVETFKTPNGNDVNITLIKHATLAIEFKGYEIHVDAVPNYGTDYSKFPKGDLILVTHEHGDHFNPETIESLMKPNSLLFMNQRCFNQMHNGIVLRNGDSRRITKDISMKTVPAYNTTPDHLQFHPKGVGNGYVLNIDGLKIYIAGDTEDIPEMSELKDENIDVAFLPVNQPFTMTVDQAIRAAWMIQPKVLIPYHFGQTDVAPIKQRLESDGSGIEVWLREMQ
ncbi:MAG: MBL fold metallo-hydrolase [Bacteroidaceae bacterium]|nr:MBL fold metallo-hydrolase [Bacteroidaceae bacterium]